MWKYLAGVEKPKKRTAEEKLDLGREYDKAKRVRTFQGSWKINRPWLYIEPGKDGVQTMFCKVCKEHPEVSDPNSQLVVGTSNMKIETLTKHESSHKHIKAAAAANAHDAPGKMPADKMIRQMNETQFARLQRLFLTSHALVSKGRPFTDFKWLCALDKAKETDIGDTYNNDKACRSFAYYIAEAERIKLESEIKACHFYALLSDGSTDSSIKEVEIIYLRRAHQGIVKTDFIGLSEMEKADAASITSGILETCDNQINLNQHELMSKVVGFGSDGASVMLGCNSGVATRLKNIQKNELNTDTPILQSIHCFNHRLELAYKETLNTLPFHEKVQLHLENLYRFYHYSPLNRSMLKRSCEALGIKFLAPPRVSGTRWLPHTRRALETLLAIYPAVIQHCQQLQQSDMRDKVNAETKAKAKGFLDVMLSPRFVLYDHFLSDIVMTLSKLSLKFQGYDWYSAGDMKYEINSCKDKLSTYRTEPGPYFRKVTYLLQESADTLMYQGHQLTTTARMRGPSNTPCEFENDKKKLIDKLIASLGNRFQDCNDQVVNALSFAHLKHWPEQEGNYGNDSIATLTDQFRPILVNACFSAEEAEEEWPSLRHKIFCSTNFEQRQNFESRPTWAALNAKYGGEYRNILALVDIALTVPASNAQCERGFSYLKMIKSDWRSTLTVSSVNDIMRIVLHSDPIGSYDPTAAIALWLKSGVKPRRLSIKPYGKRVKSGEESSYASSSSEEENDD